MRQAITITKKRDGSSEMTSGPEVPYDQQRAAFNALPANNSDNGDITEIKLVKISRETVKTRHFAAPTGKPKASMKNAK